MALHGPRRAGACATRFREPAAGSQHGWDVGSAQRLLSSPGPLGRALASDPSRRPTTGGESQPQTVCEAPRSGLRVWLPLHSLSQRKLIACFGDIHHATRP